jgi:hypothetical protein
VSGSWPGSGNGIDKGAGDKFSGRVGSVKEGKKMNINEVIDKMRSELKGAASGEGAGIDRRVSGAGKGGSGSRRC